MKGIILICLFLIAVICLIALTYAAYACAGWGKKFYHDRLGFHLPEYEYTWTYLGRHFTRCKICGCRMIQTTSGEWRKIQED